VPGLLAALDAVTRVRSAEVTGNSEAHATTEAGAWASDLALELPKN